MTLEVVTCDENDEIATAAATMVRKAIRRLVVLAPDGRLAGVISVDDLAHLGAEGGAPALTARPSRYIPSATRTS